MKLRLDLTIHCEGSLATTLAESILGEVTPQKNQTLGLVLAVGLVFLSYFLRWKSFVILSGVYVNHLLFHNVPNPLKDGED